MRKAKKIFGNVDWLAILLYLFLIFFGWINIYASQYNDDQKLFLDFSQRYGKQLIFIAASLFVAFTILILDWKFFEVFSYYLYGGIIFLLIILLITGNTTAGSTSWFEIGNYKFQPSEFAKFATILALARYLNTHNVTGSMTRNRSLVCVERVLLLITNRII